MPTYNLYYARTILFDGGLEVDMSSFIGFLIANWQIIAFVVLMITVIPVVFFNITGSTPFTAGLLLGMCVCYAGGNWWLSGFMFLLVLSVPAVCMTQRRS